MPTRLQIWKALARKRQSGLGSAPEMRITSDLSHSPPGLGYCGHCRAPRWLGLGSSPVETVLLQLARSVRDVLLWTGLIPLAILLCSGLSLKAGNVVWTLNATFADGGTAAGVFTFDS